MHIFLTGEVGVGKSTALRGAVDRLGVPVGGFQTYFGADRGAPDRVLYMGPAAESRAFLPERAVVRFIEGQPLAVPGRFDSLGVALLEGAKSAPLVVMDECGKFERDAALFHQKVLGTLDGSKPVLGVVRLGAGGWTEAILSHPRVRLLVVTRENRDCLPLEIASAMAGFLR